MTGAPQSTPSRRRVPFSSKLAFGVGQLAEGLKNTSFGLFVLFYYNQVLGVSGTLCGLALGIALLFDAVTDPLAGSLSDNWKSRLGRRHPFMYASAVPLAIAFYGLFSPPSLGETGLFVWLVAFSVLTRGAMTLYHVPHISLGAELSSDFEERTSIVAYRQAFGYVGGVTAAVLAFGYFFTDAAGGRLNPDAYPTYATMLCVLMVATIWASAWGTQKEIPHLPEAPANPESRVLRRLVSEVAGAFSNHSFRWLFAGVLIVFLMVGVEGALNIYLNQYFWELNSRQFLALALASPAGLIVGTIFVRPLHRRFDKRPGLVFGTGGWAILQVLPIILRLLGWFPENSAAALMPTLLVMKFAQGAIVQQALVSFGSMMADVVDEHELDSGRRQEGVFFGAVAFSGKGASGLGTFVAGLGLDVISWPRGPEIQTAADVAPEALINLGLLAGPVVCGFAAVSVWCYTGYKLDRTRHAQILEQLAVQRAGRSEVPPAQVAVASTTAGFAKTRPGPRSNPNPNPSPESS